MEFTLLMPCLNESETLASCISKAHQGAKNAHISSYEVLIADNGSTDGSVEIAHNEGAHVVHVKDKGYGAALMGGIKEARGRYIIMADADDSYDWSQLTIFVRELHAGYDLVMGTRLKGEIKAKAMPWLHRYLGNPVLTFVGNLFYKTGFSDFHCGMRGFTKTGIESLNLRTTGMEFASEMVIKAALANLKRTEVPIILYPDGRSRPPHLRTWRDGWRHLRFMMLYSPRWLFIYPGIIAALIGLGIVLLLLPGILPIGRVILDVHTLLVGAMIFLAGTQILGMGIIADLLASRYDLQIQTENKKEWIKRFSLETGLGIGFVFMLLGFFVIMASFIYWAQDNFGDLDYRVMLRLLIPGMMLALFGLQIFFYSFLVSFLNILVIPKISLEGDYKLD